MIRRVLYTDLTRVSKAGCAGKFIGGCGLDGFQNGCADNSFLIQSSNKHIITEVKCNEILPFASIHWGLF